LRDRVYGKQMKGRSKSFKRIYALALLYVVLLFSSCAQIQLRTAWALKDFDYFTVDPGIIRLALSLPEGAVLDSATMNMQFTRDGRLEIDQSVAFDILATGREIAAVGFPSGVNATMVLRVPFNRVRDIVTYQQALLEAKDNGLKASATFGINSSLNPAWIENYCAAGHSEMQVKAWVRVSEPQGYMPLVRESDLMKLLEVEGRNVCEIGEQN
jgi:hypothetical protein